MYRILIVEDELLELKAVKFILENCDLPIGDIVTASNGFEAISAAECYKPDIAILDIKIPGIDGIEVARKISQTLPGTKMIMLTAYSDFEYTKQAITLKVNDYLKKPIEDDELIQSVENCINELIDDSHKTKAAIDAEVKYQLIKSYFERELVTSFVLYKNSQEVINEYFTLLGIEENQGRCMLISFDEKALKKLPKIKRDMVLRRTTNKISEYYQEEEKRVLLSIIDEKIYVIIFDGASEESLHLNIGNRLYGFINEATMVDCKVAISECFTAVQQIHNLFMDMVVDEKIMEDKVYINAVQPKAANFMTESMGDLADQMVDLIAEHEPNSTENIRQLVFRESEAAGKDEQVMAKWISDLMEMVVQRLNYETILTVPKYDYYGDLSKLITKNQMISYLMTFLKKESQVLGQLQSVDSNAISVQDACTFIKKHYMEDVTLERISTEAGFSSYYFSKLFKSYMGTTFIQYLTDVRIGHAKSLLGNSNKPIKEISETVGIANPNYFAIVFKRVTGRTPNSYRKNIRQEACREKDNAFE